MHTYCKSFVQGQKLTFDILFYNYRINLKIFLFMNYFGTELTTTPVAPGILQAPKKVCTQIKGTQK